jgi:predicted Zn-dependent protease
LPCACWPKNLAAPWLERLTVLEPQEKVWRQMLDKALAHLPANTVVPDSSSPSDEGFATMTMVDIYMEQGYYSKALAALKLIQARNPGRPDVKARLVEVLAKLDEPGGHPSANGPDAPVTRSQDMAARRTREKQRFAEWLDGFQPENGSQS